MSNEKNRIKAHVGTAHHTECNTKSFCEFVDASTGARCERHKKVPQLVGADNKTFGNIQK